MAEKLDIFEIVFLEDIFIYIENPIQNYKIAVRWILDILRKHTFFVNFKKCYFYKDRACFLGYIILAQGIKMEDKRIEAVKNWPKPKSVRDIQVFLGFTNFYYRFI